jgi:hypothetical protein
MIIVLFFLYYSYDIHSSLNQNIFKIYDAISRQVNFFNRSFIYFPNFYFIFCIWRISNIDYRHYFFFFLEMENYEFHEELGR